MAPLEQRARLRHGVTRIGHRHGAVNGHSAHLHRREHVAQSPGTEPLHEPGDQARTRIGHEGAGRRMAARRQLRPPDGGLRLGLAGQPAKELRTHGAGFRVRARAIEKCGALLLAPGLERVHCRVCVTSWQPRSAPSRRAKAAARRRAPACSRSPAKAGSRP